MLCYDLRIQYEDNDYMRNKESEEKENEKKAILQKFNAEAFMLSDEEFFYAFAYRTEEGYFDFLVAVWSMEADTLEIQRKMKYMVEDLYPEIEIQTEKISEVTTKRYMTCLEDAFNHSYLARRMWNVYKELELDYHENSCFQFHEEVIEQKIVSKKQAYSIAGGLMADQSFLEEIHRIYASENMKKYYGNPVHYHVLAGDKETAMQMIKLLVQMLYSRNRILSTRLNIISDMEDICSDDEDLKNIFKHAEGAAVVIELSGISDHYGNYVSGSSAFIKYVVRLIRKYCQKTLFIFWKNTREPGFENEMFDNLREYLDIIELREGHGGKKKALEYFHQLVKNSSYADLADASFENFFSENTHTYTCYDVHRTFNKWSREILQMKVYRAYRECIHMDAGKGTKKNTAYEELQEMVGLREVKDTLEQIIAFYKMDKIREKCGRESFTKSKHMVFTGNPGSAKTSVARLLGDIFTEEGIINSGVFVECGRADLVGRYVGWTAKMVRRKFMKARGGILFIDEAYSLVDDSGSFGDEAINTIVQEMENHRNDVIVIFAGYPDKMKEFLEKNEGMKSRIAFCLNFPDYQPEELLQIMKLMVKKHGFCMEKEAEEKCRTLFLNSSHQENFGNGRFVRNVLEQAVLKQSQYSVSVVKTKI